MPAPSLLGWERALLESSHTAVLATINPGGEPNLVPVCFARVDGLIAVAVDEKPKSGRELARIRNLRRDPRAALLVDFYDGDDWTRLAWLRLECRAIVHASGESWPEGLTALRLRYRQYGPMDLEHLPLLALQVQRKVSWRWDG